jgi:Secretion system C-terminal sorting domain
MKGLTITILLLCSLVLNAQIYWSKQLNFDFKQGDYLYCVNLADDGNLMIGGGGVKASPFIQRTNIYAKIDSKTGNILFERSFPLIGGISKSITLNNGAETIFEGPFLDSTTSYNNETYLTKVNNSTGDTIWNRIIGKPDRSEYPHLKCILSSKKQLVMAGYEVEAVPIGIFNFNLVFADTNGILLKSCRYTTDSTVNNYGWSVAETPDKGFLILGFNKYDITITFHSIRDLILLKVDSVGNLLNTHIYPAFLSTCHRGYIGTDILPKKDGNFLICGFRDYKCQNEDFTANYQFTTVNSDGELLDSVTSEKHFNCDANRMIPTTDGNFLVCGYERDLGSDPKYAMLMKVSQDMKILWKRLYRTSPPQSTEHDQFRDVVEMPDGGFVLAGTAFGPLADSTFQNGWVIRVDSLGCLTPGCDTIISTTNPIPDEVAGISIYPNPTSDEVFVQMDDDIVLGYRLLDMSGRVLQDLQYLRQAGVKQFSVTLRDESAGIYILAVHTDNGWLLKKVVKT